MGPAPWLEQLLVTARVCTFYYDEHGRRWPLSSNSCYPKLRQTVNVNGGAG